MASPEKNVLLLEELVFLSLLMLRAHRRPMRRIEGGSYSIICWAHDPVRRPPSFGVMCKSACLPSNSDRNQRSGQFRNWDVTWTGDSGLPGLRGHHPVHIAGEGGA